MYKPYLLISFLFFINFSAQDFEEFKQSIDAYGHFNISFDKKLFDERFETKVELIEIIEQNNPELLTLFQKKFPQIYDGKCLKINKKNSDDFFFCDRNKKDEIPEDRFTTLGKFQLVYILDDYYFFKYSGFEISGYLMYHSKDSSFYSFCSKPFVSKDRKYMYAYENSIYGFTLNILQLDYYKELSYHLNGIFKAINLQLTQYKNTDNYSILLDLKEDRKIRNENYEVIKTEDYNHKIRIN